jgi:hypothetical protein
VDIEYRKNGRRWLAEVWDQPVQKLSGVDRTVPSSEEQYIEINQWCVTTLKYHARTAYHVFEFKNKKDLEWFLLRWS